MFIVWVWDLTASDNGRDAEDGHVEVVVLMRKMLGSVRRM